MMNIEVLKKETYPNSILFLKWIALLMNIILLRNIVFEVLNLG